MTLARLHHLGVALALGTLGTAFLHASASGQVKTLLHPLLQPLVLAAGIVLLAAAVLHCLLTPASLPPLPGAIFARQAARNGLAVLALLIGLAAAPHSFSSLALANRTVADPAVLLKGKGLDAQAPAWRKDSSGAIKLEAVDLLMAAEHPETIREIEGQRVRFIGQFVPDSADRFKLTRFLMYCCAADAQPIRVRVDAGNAPGFAPLASMAWAVATGTVHFREEIPGKRLPVVTLEKIESIPEPANKFLY
jgi:uncharacterized repeat protein (TIGR03943 family)